MARIGTTGRTGGTQCGPTLAPPPARPGVLRPHGTEDNQQREGVRRSIRQVALPRGIRTGARASPTKGDNLQMENPGINTIAGG